MIPLIEGLGITAFFVVLSTVGYRLLRTRKSTELPTEPPLVPTVEPKVVAAVLSAINVGSLDGERGRSLHKILEDAEVRAVLDCISEGIDLHSADIIIPRKAAYRQQAMDAFYAQV